MAHFLLYLGIYISGMWHMTGTQKVGRLGKKKGKKESGWVDGWIDGVSSTGTS